MHAARDPVDRLRRLDQLLRLLLGQSEPEVPREVGVVGRQREDADALPGQRLEQPGEDTDHREVQRAGDLEAAQRPLLDDAVGSRDLQDFGPVGRSRDSYEAEMTRRWRDVIDKGLPWLVAGWAGFCALFAGGGTDGVQPHVVPHVADEQQRAAGRSDQEVVLEG